MVELPACQTHNPVILSSSPTLATCYICFQSPWRAKKVVSNSLGLVDFAIRLGNSNYRRIVINPANPKEFWG